MITERYLFSLLHEEHDFVSIIKELEGLNREWEPGLECHHIEPDREKTIWLTPSEHLAIHIAHARLNPNGSNRAKVSAFVKYYPGSARFVHKRFLKFSDELTKALVSFGQARPDSYNLLLNQKAECKLCGQLITGRANLLRHQGSKQCQKNQTFGGSVLKRLMT